MALFLPPTIVIDVWLLFEPPTEPPADPAEGSDGTDGAASDVQARSAIAAASAMNCDPASESDSLYDGYHLVPAYFWHREDNGLSMPWQHLVDTQLEDDRQPAEAKPHPARAPRAPDEAPPLPESSE